MRLLIAAAAVLVALALGIGLIGPWGSDGPPRDAMAACVNGQSHSGLRASSHWVVTDARKAAGGYRVSGTARVAGHLVRWSCRAVQRRGQWVGSDYVAWAA